MSHVNDLEKQAPEQSADRLEVNVRFLIHIGKDYPIKTRITCSADATVMDLVDRLAVVHGQKLKVTMLNQRFLTLVDGVAFSFRGLDEKLNTDNKSSIEVTFLPVFNQGG